MSKTISMLAILPILGLTAAATAAKADVTILRGSAVETVATGGSGPAVLRGGGSLREAPAAPAPRPRYAHVTAGETLWLVDAAGESVTACTLRETGYVGKRQVVCTRHK